MTDRSRTVLFSLLAAVVALWTAGTWIQYRTVIEFGECCTRALSW